MRKMQTCLWFDGNAEQAVDFYKSLFPDFKIGTIMRYGPDMHYPEGTVLTIEFELFGQDFFALNAGPHFTFTPATSFLINCEDQAELDRYWDGLLDGGEAMQCGWITDRFGVTWQITPRMLMKWINDADPVKAQRVMQAMMGMVKLDFEGLRVAYEG